ncbi:unnamed protein product, partial [Prorocentrum cordatum]
MSCTWEDLAIDDGPQAPVDLVGMLLECVRADCLDHAFLARLPEGLLLAALRAWQEGPAGEAAAAAAGAQGEREDRGRELREATSRLQGFKRGLDSAGLLDPPPQKHAMVWHTQRVISG